MSKEIDDAFNWIILVLTTISGFLIDLPDTSEVKKVVASGFIVPLLALYAIWFMSYFIRAIYVRLTLKTFGWFYATFISMMLVFFMDVCYGLDPLLSGLARQFTPLILVLFIVFFTPHPLLPVVHPSNIQVGLRRLRILGQCTETGAAVPVRRVDLHGSGAAPAHNRHKASLRKP